MHRPNDLSFAERFGTVGPNVLASQHANDHDADRDEDPRSSTSSDPESNAIVFARHDVKALINLHVAFAGHGPHCPRLGHLVYREA